METKIKEGSSRLLAAARHPAQSLEAARTLFTSNKRMSVYMTELEHRRRDALLKTRYQLYCTDETRIIINYLIFYVSAIQIKEGNYPFRILDFL